MAGRGQASLEYLLTYGWGFLVILITIGALAYFGVLNPSRFVPEKCEFGTQLNCVDWELDVGGSGNDNVRLLLRNSFGKDILIEGVKAITDDGVKNAIFIPSTTDRNISAGGTGDFTFRFKDDEKINLEPGSKPRIILEIDVKRDMVGATTHTIRGSIYSTVQ